MDIKELALNIVTQHLHWSLSGILFGCIMLALHFLNGNFGLSGSYRLLCSVGGAGLLSPAFKMDWKSEIWHLVFVGGIVVGGLCSHLSHAAAGLPSPVQLAADRFLTWEPLSLISVFAGGLVSGFGSRYAGGCTSGHFVSGISNLQFSSLLTLILFMLGGLISSSIMVVFNL